MFLARPDLLEALVEEVVCAVDRSEGEHPKLDAAGLELWAVFELAELLQAGAQRLRQDRW